MPTALFRYCKNRLKFTIFSAFCSDFCGDFGIKFNTINITFSMVRGSVALDVFFGD